MADRSFPMLLQVGANLQRDGLVCERYTPPGLSRGHPDYGLVMTNVPRIVFHYEVDAYSWGSDCPGARELALNLLAHLIPVAADGRSPIPTRTVPVSHTAWHAYMELATRYLAVLPWEGGRLDGLWLSLFAGVRMGHTRRGEDLRTPDGIDLAGGREES